MLVGEERADRDDGDVHRPAQARRAREDGQEKDRDDVERGRDPARRRHAEAGRDAVEPFGAIERDVEERVEDVESGDPRHRGEAEEDRRE